MASRRHRNAPCQRDFLTSYSSATRHEWLYLFSTRHECFTSERRSDSYSSRFACFLNLLNGLCSAPCLWVQVEQDHYTGLCSNHDNKRGRVCVCVCACRGIKKSVGKLLNDDLKMGLIAKFEVQIVILGSVFLFYQSVRNENQRFERLRL